MRRWRVKNGKGRVEIAATVGLLVVVYATSICGCRHSSSTSPDDKESTKDVIERPLGKMRLRVRRNQWQEAMELVDLVRANHSDDSEALALAAQVAHRNERPNLSADLLREACQADDYQSEALIQQAVVAMTTTGRLFDGIELLENAVDASPEMWMSRRLLFDLLMGAEDRVSGLPHGRYLVRNRQFDAELLLTLSDTVRRSNDPTPLQQMVDRNPADKRPLIGQARVLLDDAKYGEVISLLSEITDLHPDFAPATAMQMHALAQADRLAELEQLCSSLPQVPDNYPRYWMAVGVWLEAKGKSREATRAYWQAIQLDPDWLVPWNQMISSMQRIDRTSSDFDGKFSWQTATEDVTEAASVLGQFNQARSRFIRTGGVSRELAVQIAELLEQLGRLWEAEAWTAIALTLPEDEAVQVKKVRQSIVRQMKADLPWHSQSPHLKAEWSARLEGISLAGLIDRPTPAKTDTAEKGIPAPEPAGMSSNESHFVSSIITLTDEADSRNLRFFGRTSDHLDKPGIMLHHTLGCGGGVLDYDLDGWPDLYLGAAGGTPAENDSANNALMRNRSGQFTNVTQLSDTSDFGFAQGISCGDLNEDGFDDLVVMNYGADTVLLNQGDGTFMNVTARWFGSDNDPNWSTSAAIADIDLDGIADLVIAKYCAGLEPSTVTCPIEETGEIRSCSPVFFNSEPDAFFRGRATGGFENVNKAWQAEPVTPGRGLGVTVGSFDSEPGIEVLVANDMSANHFWKLQHAAPNSTNSGSTLVETALPRGLAFDRESRAQGSMGIATGDFDRDGHFDFYVTNFDKEYNTLSLQRSSGIWQDATSIADLVESTMPLVGFGTQAVDFDNDQSLELMVSNGHVDLFNRGKERSVYAQPVQIFSRMPAGGFRELPRPVDGQSYLSRPHVGRALFVLDADRDGRQDVVVTHQTEPVALLMNRTVSKNQPIALTLVGTTGSRNAVGAVVRVDNGQETYVAQVTSGDGYLCTNEKLLHFAIVESNPLLKLSVRWPNGATESFPTRESKGSWLLVEGTGETSLLGQ